MSRSGYAWASLASLDRQSREREMREYLTSVLALDEADRPGALREMIEAEYRLEAPQLREFTASRLRVWAGMLSSDPEGVARLADGYDTVFDSLGAGLAMRRTQTVQQVLRGDLSEEDLDSLAKAIPSVARELPKAPPQPARGASAVKRRAPGWKFWERQRT